MSSMYEKLLKESGNGHHDEYGFEPGDFGLEFGNLFELMARQMYEGKPVLTATLQAFAQEGRLVFCLQHRQIARKAFRGAETWEKALQSLEKGLAEGSLEWRDIKDMRVRR